MEKKSTVKFDFSKIEELEKELESEKEKYNFIKDMVDCGLWEYNIKTKKLTQSKGLNYGGHGEIPNYRETIKNSDVIYPDDVAVFDKFVDSMDAGEPAFTYDMRMDIGTDKYVWVRFEGYMQKGVDGKPEKIIGRSLNVDSEKNSEKIVIKRAVSDKVTGLLTQEAFVSQVSATIQKRGDKAKHAFVLLDINNFGAINKKWGESYGEYVIETFGNALAELFKEGELVARIEGDAFAVFKQSISSVKSSSEVVKTIVGMTKNLKFKREHELSICAGIATAPADGSDYSTLYKKAAIALTAAKKKPEKIFEFYTESLTAEPHEVIPTKEQKEATESRKIIQDQKQSEYGKVEKFYIDKVMEMLASDDANPGEINKILAEVGKYYKYTRIYTYNYDKRGAVCAIKYFWNSRTIPYMRVYERVVDAQWDKVYARFKNDALFISENTATLDFQVPGELASVFTPASVLQYKVFEDNNAVTCITYERPQGESFEKEESDFLLSFSKLLSIYMERIRTREGLQEEIEYSRDVMNNQLVTDYAVKKDSYQLVFVGDANGRQYIAEEDNLLCYKTVMGRKEPCKNCPLSGIRGEDAKERCAMESYFEKNKKWFTSTATSVKHGEEEYDFICWTDVSNFVDRMKSKDVLTGQMTVEKFEQTVESKVSLMRKPQNIFVYFNVPNFGEINDLWGYSICDEVLIQLSAAVAESLGEEEYMARVTGATFVLFLEYDDKDRITARLDMIMQQAIAAVHRMYPDVKLGIWAGLYRMNGHGQRVTDMIEAANTARKSISTRVNTGDLEVAFHDDVIKTGATFENFVKNNMKNALENHEFRVFFMPKRDEDGEIVKADAVVRWVTKEGSVIERESFAGIMQEEGAITQLDAYVHEETFRLLDEWIKREIKPPLISLSCSQEYMFSPEFMARTKKILKDFPVPTNLVEFVIPEGVNESNFYRVVSILQELQAMGFVISLDSYMTKFALNSMRTVKMIEENPGLRKLDDIQVEVKTNKMFNPEDFVLVIDDSKEDK